MEEFDPKAHWENIYRNKAQDEVSWFQSTPQSSLQLIQELNLPATAKVIDVGGGDSLLIDHLLNLGYKDVTVLDISQAAIEKAKTRLGTDANKVKWIVGDISRFQPVETYDLWHDRAAFHFLTQEEDILNYLSITRKCIKPKGNLIIGTFSDKGPKKCSGIEIRQYTENSMTELMEEDFEKIGCTTIDHHTPFDTLQNFLFCVFRRVRSGMPS